MIMPRAAVKYSVLLVAVAILSVHAQFLVPLNQTTECLKQNGSPRCRPPLKLGDFDPCKELNCTGGVVVDNVKCPCCYRCAKQIDEECSPETENDRHPYNYCDGAGLRCQKFRSQISSIAVGRCVGEI